MFELRERLRDHSGFTLIELLVVILIIGILAAIAIPAFLGQRQKAQDSAAKSASRNAASAAESYAVDSGSYAGLALSNLTAIEPSLNDTGGLGAQVAIVGTPDVNGYTVSTKSKSGTFHNLTRASGNTYRCTGSAAAVCTASSTPKW